MGEVPFLGVRMILFAMVLDLGVASFEPVLEGESFSADLGSFCSFSILWWFRQFGVFWRLFGVFGTGFWGFSGFFKVWLSFSIFDDFGIFGGTGSFASNREVILDS